MSEPIIYIDRSEVRSGKLQELRGSMDDLAAFVAEKEPQLLSYGFFLDEDEARLTVVAIHPDPASLEFHLEIGGSRFRGFAELLEMLSIDVYGEPSDAALEALHHKARMLGTSGTVAVHRLQAGFARLQAPSDAP